MWEEGGHVCRGIYGQRLMHLEYLTWPTGTMFLTSVISCLLSKLPNGGRVFLTKPVPGKLWHESC